MVRGPFHLEEKHDDDHLCPLGNLTQQEALNELKQALLADIQPSPSNSFVHNA